MEKIPGIVFRLHGKYGHFKRPETNDNPSTYSFMHKIALVGFVGCVVGIERQDMKNLYGQLCEDLIYSIQLLSPVVKEPHAFTKRNTMPANFFKSGRRFCEMLKDIDYRITIALRNERSREVFNSFCEFIKESASAYSPYFGIVSCPSNVEFVEMTEVSGEKNGEFVTDAVFSAGHTIGDAEGDVSFEWIPTRIVPDGSTFGLYDPKGLVQTVISGNPVRVSGPYRETSGRKSWFL